jgi:hypothetical protein
MKAIRIRTLFLGALAVLLLAPGQALAARAFSESGSFDGRESPAGGFSGACGLAVDPGGEIYVADYYHHVVDIYSPGHRYMSQLKLPPTNGPCGLAVDSARDLYVDIYHEAVERYAPGSPTPTVIETADSTGVAVDPASGDLYVDERTAVEVFDPTGTPLRRIELSSGADAYGVAVSDTAANEGDVYVADAATDEVEVYGPTGTLVGRIDGAGDPRGGFVDLADAALAVDQTSGDLLVAEDLEPGFEAPAAAVEEFAPTGVYLGALTHPLIDAVPSGLATTAAGGLYVGSGNGPGASVLAFGTAGSQPLFTTSPTTLGEGTAAPVSSQAPDVFASPMASREALVVSSSAGMLRVLAPGPGVLHVEGTDVVSVSRRIAADGISLRLRLDRRGSRALAHTRAGALHAQAQLRFEPAGGGDALTARSAVTFRQAPDERKR